MAFSHQFGENNVAGSINSFLKNNLGTNVPSFMTWSYGATPPRTLNFDYPDIPLTFPSFSVTHLSSVERDTFQGDRADGSNRGIWREGQFEVDCWVSSDNNPSWPSHLRTMRDMVFKLFEQNRSIALSDYATPPSPVALKALARIVRMEEQHIEEDPSPQVKRIRILIIYEFMERF